jgi:hypothetical protein
VTVGENHHSTALAAGVNARKIPAAGELEMCIRNWIAAFGVLGTWLVFVGAIWGEKIRSWLFKPRLSVILDDPRGVAITETITIFTNSQQGQQMLQQYTRPARYYYLSVRTARRWPLAHDVRILIIRLERPEPGGLPTTVWTGEIPLAWEHGQIQPASRTLGRPARADFVVAAQDPVDIERRNQLHLVTMIEPSNMQRSQYSATQFWITVIATSNEGDSPPLRLEVAWDGQWDAAETEMGQHLKNSATSGSVSPGPKGPEMVADWQVGIATRRRCVLD